MNAPSDKDRVLEDNRDFTPRKHLYIAGSVGLALLLLYFASLKLVLG